MVHINGRIGSMSYNILDDPKANLLEGIVFIQHSYPYYNKNKLEDSYSNMKYSVQMIQHSLEGIMSIEKFYKVIIFDILIGNSDRHHSNWAIKPKGHPVDENNTIKITTEICPLYDNGSSLCSYEDNSDLNIFFKDKMKFEALVNTKSKSAIGWENKRPIRHFELLQKLKDNVYDLTIDYIQKIKENINEQSIDTLLNEFDNSIISKDMKKLLKMYILERRKRMLEIYNLKDEV